jgi:hypothetical protein
MRVNAVGDLVVRIMITEMHQNGIPHVRAQMGSFSLTHFLGERRSKREKKENHRRHFEDPTVF